MIKGNLGPREVIDVAKQSPSTATMLTQLSGASVPSPGLGRPWGAVALGGLKCQP